MLSQEEPSFPSSAQKQLHQALYHRLGPGPAAMYEDIYRLLSEERPYRSTTHLVAHLLREIESAFRWVLIPYDLKPDPDEKENHKKQIEIIANAYPVPAELSARWIALATRGKGRNGFAEFAHREALAAPRSLDAECRTMVAEFEEVLKAFLDAFERQSFDVFSLLDDLIQQQPGRQAVSTFYNSVPANTVTYTYFFTHLENPAWLDLLHRKGGFAPGVSVIEDGYLRYSPWPQAEYLKKMAVRYPALYESIARIIFSVAETHNPFVQQSLLEIALLLPIPLAVQMLPFVEIWLQTPEAFTFTPPNVQQFLEVLAQGGEVEKVIGLFASLMPSFDSPHESKHRLEVEQLLLDIVPVLMLQASHSTLTLLCILLEKEVYHYYTRSRQVEPGDPEAALRAKMADTRFWLPTIESEDPLYTGGASAAWRMLATGLRKAAEQAVMSGDLDLNGVISVLEQFTGKIFARQILYLLSQCAEQDVSLAQRWLMRRDLFDEFDARREYGLLAQATLPLLSEEEQQPWFAWIEEGPSQEELQRWHQSVQGETPTTEDDLEYKARWQRDYLGAALQGLPPQWRDRYAELEERYGAYEEEFRIIPWAEARRRPQKDIERTLSAGQWVQAYERAQTNEDEAEDLLAALPSLIAESPGRFADEAQMFLDQAPEVILPVLRGFLSAVQSGQDFHWYHLLHLCAWVVEQRTSQNSGEGEVYDVAWAVAGKAVADLLVAALNWAGDSIPYPFGEMIWRMVSFLVDDPYRMSEDTDASSPLRHYSNAVNSTRGMAFLSVLLYARWRKRHWQEARVGEEALAWHIRCTPEVEELVRRVLWENDAPAPDVVAMCGRAVPLLLRLDKEWALAHLPLLFPHEEEKAEWYEASWTNYLICNTPSQETFAALKQEYVYTIGHFSAEEKPSGDRNEVGERMAWHLLVAYGSGWLPLEDEDRVLYHFFERAPVSFRRSFLSQVGTRCATHRQHLDAQCVERYQRLWEWRLDACAKAGAYDELGAFLLWVASDAFPALWTVQQLNVVLSLGVAFEHSGKLVEHFPAYSEVAPLPTLRCLELLVKTKRRFWWRSEDWETVRELLSAALGKGEQSEEYLLASGIISLLALNGHADLRALLRPSS